MARETISSFLLGSDGDRPVDDGVSGYHLFASVVALPIVGATAVHGAVVPACIWALTFVQNALFVEWDQHPERYDFDVVGMLVRGVTQLAITTVIFLVLFYPNGVMA